MQIRVLVKPGASKDDVSGEVPELTVTTKARAQDGEANKAVEKLVAQHLGVAPSLVRVAKGLKSRGKVLEITS